VSDFKGWSVGRCVNVLEELSVRGDNRHKALNAVKPLITDTRTQVNEKGINQYDTINTTNYIAFTNFKDAIPMEDTDRRWFIIFAPYADIKSFEKAARVEHDEYFDRLYGALKRHYSEIRRWMLDYPISDEFKAAKRAPMTAAKRRMVESEESSIDGLDDVVDALAEGGFAWNKVCVSPKHLLNHLNSENLYANLPDGKFRRILKRLGFETATYRPSIAGKPTRVWTKGQLSDEQIRQSLS
jgi:hypothetical protein